MKRSIAYAKVDFEDTSAAKHGKLGWSMRKRDFGNDDGGRAVDATDSGRRTMGVKVNDRPWKNFPSQTHYPLGISCQVGSQI